MYKVLLIDDEPWILKDMEMLIDWGKFNFEVIAKITDSDQAIYMIKKYQPELIICDIRMPGLNGIELMKKVKKRFKDIFVVFVSAYSEFNYAKQAIELGAFDYILKPTDESELSNTLQKICFQLNKKKEERLNLIRYKRAELFLELIEDRIDSQIIKGKLKALGYHFSSDYFFIAVVNLRKDSKPEKWQNAFRDYFSDYSLLFIQLGEQKWVVLFNCQTTALNQEKIELMDKNIADKYSLSIGISKFFKNLSNIKHFYKQAELMSYNYFIYKKYGVYLYSNYNNNYKDISLTIRKITSLDEFKKKLIKLADIIIKRKINLEEMAYLYNQLREKANTLFDLDLEIELMDYVDIVYSFNNPGELFAQLLEFINSQTDDNPTVSHDIVGQIILEIESDYNKDLKLQDLADKYHINYNYLSQLFKKETGQTFTNYLVELRIEKAIELFSEDLLFYEIAKRVGYNDYYHFCKLFKKHKGLSPSEYKRNA